MKFDKIDFKKIIEDPDSNFPLWIFLLSIFLLLPIGAWLVHHFEKPKFKQVLQINKVDLKKMNLNQEAPNPAEGLHVLIASPMGEIPAQSEGIKILFDHPMIPFTEVDPDKHPGIDLKIEPPIKGEFRWVGSKGMEYRFLEELPLARNFRAILPKGLKSLDGKELAKEHVIEFHTSEPVARFVSPRSGQSFVKVSTPLKINFSQKMNRAEIEAGLSCHTITREADPLYPNNRSHDKIQSSDCEEKMKFSWEAPKKAEDLSETLFVSADKGWKLNTEYEFLLAKELSPLTGDRKTSVSPKLGMHTAEPMKLERIYVAHAYPDSNVWSQDESVTDQLFSRTEDAKELKKLFLSRGTIKLDKKLPTGDICFEFNNPINRKNFESSVQFIPQGAEKPDPSARITYYYQDRVYGSEEEENSEMETATDPQDLPQRTACVSPSSKFNHPYEIRITKALEDRLGQTDRPDLTPQRILFQTMHAGLEGTLDITKKMLYSKKLPLLPYTSINAEKMQLKLIPCRASASTLSHGNPCENAQSEEGEGEDSYEANASSVDAAEEKNKSEEAKDPYLKEFTISAPYDEYYHGKISLAEAYPHLQAGFYMLEVTFFPMSEMTLKKKVKKLGIDTETLVQAEPVTTSKTLLLTQTALALKHYENKTVVWALDIESGKPLAQLPIQIWRDQQLVATGYTNSDGILELLNNQIDLPAEYEGHLTVIVDDPKYYSLLSTEKDVEGLEASSFGYEFEKPTQVKNYFAFLHTDRPVYRPGQKVFFSGFVRGLREGVYHLPSDLKEVDLKIVDSNHSEIYKKKLPLSVTGVLEDEILLGGEEIPRGRYSLNISIPTLSWKGEAKTQSFTKIFYVNSYKKPDFKLSLSSSTDEALSGEPIKIKAQGEYYFGAKLKNAELSWNIRQEAYRFKPKAFQDYSFVDEEKILKKKKKGNYGDTSYSEEKDFFEEDGKVLASGVYSTDSDSRIMDPKIKHDPASSDNKTGIEAVVVADVYDKLDEQGLFEINTTPNLKEDETAQLYTLSVSAKELGAQIFAVKDFMVHRAAAYVGVKAKQKVINAGEPLQFNLVTLNTKGQRLPNRSISLKLYSREYKTIKKRNEDGNWVFESEPEDKLITTSSVQSDAQAQGTWTFPATSKGAYYRLEAEIQDEKGRINQAATLVGVGGDPDLAYKANSDVRMALATDQNFYKVGEVAKILVPEAKPGSTGLLTVERAGVLKQEVIHFEGQNTFNIPIQEDYLPNVYVSLLLFNKQGDEDATMKMGMTELKISPERKSVVVKVEPEKAKYQPKEKARVKITTLDEKGRPLAADVIVSVADESVLRLIDYESPNLVDYFYFPRKLGVFTAENMIHFKSGDGENDVVDQKKRNKFLDTAFFSGHVKTAANGEAWVEFNLPDNLTTWVAEALAVTSETRVGSAFNTFKSGVPVFARPSLPRFLAVEDVAKPTVFVENNSEENFQGSLEIAVQGGAALKSEKTFEIKLPAHERNPLEYELAGVSANEAKIAFTLKDASGSVLDILENSFPVYDRSLPQIYTASGATRDQTVEKIQMPQNLRQDRGGLEVEVSSSPLSLLQKNFAYLLSYPYGCAEQRSSALIALHELADLQKQFHQKGTKIPQAWEALLKQNFKIKDDGSLDEEALKRIYSKSLAELKTFQKRDGGFNFWTQDQGSDPFVSALVARVLALYPTESYDNKVAVDLLDYLQSVLNAQKTLPAPNDPKASADQYALDSRVELAWSMLELGQKMARDNALAREQIQTALKYLDRFSTRGLASLVLAQSILAPGPESASTQSSLWTSITQKISGKKNTALSPAIDLLRNEVQRQKSEQGERAYWKDTARVYDEVTISARVLRAFLAYDPKDELVLPSVRYLISKMKGGNLGNTQATREALMALLQYSNLAASDSNTANKIDVKLQVGKDLTQEKMFPFSLASWIQKQYSVTELTHQTQPLEMKLSTSDSNSALYYQAELSAYYPLDAIPRAEEGLMVQREFYDLKDLKEEHPLTQFELGENYKVTLMVIAEQALNQLMVEHLLPAGFEAVDFSLSDAGSYQTESLAESAEMTSPVYRSSLFTHDELHDDRVMWLAPYASYGIYKVRHIVRAAQVGNFQAPGALAHPFYESGYEGRSRSFWVEIK
ncbi:MAG: hypothetical protein HQM15_08510 [Deltaproteobacteria bacterium]|nr:hypothetical protein [Deltaproteobacteria bacterium]